MLGTDAPQCAIVPGVLTEAGRQAGQARALSDASLYNFARKHASEGIRAPSMTIVQRKTSSAQIQSTVAVPLHSCMGESWK